MSPDVVAQRQQGKGHVPSVVGSFRWYNQVPLPTTGSGTKGPIGPQINPNLDPPTAFNGYSVTAYLAEQGKPPYERHRKTGEYQIPSTSAFPVRLDGSTTIFSINQETIHDETSAFPTRRTVYTQAKAVYKAPDVDPLLCGRANPTQNLDNIDGLDFRPCFSDSGLGFALASVDVKHTTIQAPSWAHALSAVGGLLTTAIGLLWIFFKPSGYVSAEGKSMYIFKYLPGKIKYTYIKSFIPNDQVAAILRQKLAASHEPTP